MLQAISDDGMLITLATRTRKEIEGIKRDKQFFCPACKQQVIIKAGVKMIPHFAHRSKLNCPSNEGGEGAYHERGKLLLYQWLKKQQLQVELEVFLPEINQRPDLLVKLANKIIAIEYQCARVSVKEIRRRNEGYKDAGIIPIWILGENRLNRKTGNHLKIDQFSLQFIHKFSSEFPLTLYYLCPYTLQLITFQDIFITQTGQALGKFAVKKLGSMRFQDMFQKNVFLQMELYELWKREKYRFRLKPKNRLHGKELAWHQWLYLKGTYVEYLPSMIHLPVSSQFLITNPLWDWQSRLIVDLLLPLPIGSQISIQSCNYFLRNQLLNPNHFSLIHAPPNPIEEYLQLLVHAGLLQQQTPDTFTKMKPIHFYKNIENALKGDESIMNHLIKQNTSMLRS
ncbi:competence protein CoiA [Virgibacillus ainsalahensis]